MLSKPGEIDSITYLSATSKLTGIPFEALRTGEGFDLKSLSARPPQYDLLKTHHHGDFVLIQRQMLLEIHQQLREITRKLERLDVAPK